MTRKSESEYSVWLDTNFLLSYFKEKDSLHNNAREIYAHLIQQKNIQFYISTLTMAEFSQMGDTEILIRLFAGLKIISFSVEDAREYRDILMKQLSYSKQSSEQEKINRRCAIVDLMILAQCITKRVSRLVTGDKRVIKICQRDTNIEIIDLNKSIIESSSPLFINDSEYN